MSRLGKKDIEIPSGVSVTITPASEGGVAVSIKGPKGELTRNFRKEIAIISTENKINTKPQNDTIFARALWGTYASHLLNMITGVTEGFQKKLIVEGTGFKSDLRGNKLVFALGFSHSVEMDVPDGLTVSVEKNELTIAGISKELVGSFASRIRAKKVPEPYKGKGIRYHDEIIERKQGKKNVA